MSLIATGSAGEILKVAYSAVIASVLVSGIFAIGVRSISRVGETRRAGRNRVAAVYTLVAIMSLMLCAVAVIYGVVLVGQKS